MFYRFECMVGKIRANTDTVQRDALLYKDFKSSLDTGSLNHHEKVKSEILSLYEPLLRKIASKAYNNFLQKNNTDNLYSLNDFYHEAVIGFIKSLDHFDLKFGVPLFALARPYIEAQMNDFKFANNSLVKISSSLKKNLGKVYKAIKLLRKNRKNINRLELEKIAESLNIKNKRNFILQYQAYIQETPFTNEMPDGTEAYYIDKNYKEIDSDFIEDLEEHSIIKKDKNILKKHFDTLLNQLDAKERFIIKNRFLSESNKTLKDISKILKVSCERVRQIEKKALEKLKSFGGVELKNFLVN